VTCGTNEGDFKKLSGGLFAVLAQLPPNRLAEAMESCKELAEPLRNFIQAQQVVVTCSLSHGHILALAQL